VEQPKPTINGASVKVMRSFDYCHFEVTLSSTDATTPEAVDMLRKEAARLADKAVVQYQVAKAAAADRRDISARWRLEQAKRTPENERTPDEKAVIKYHSDEAFRARFGYDYEDDWSPPEYEEE
jgi:hypothetical protein